METADVGRTLFAREKGLLQRGNMIQDTRKIHEGPASQAVKPYRVEDSIDQLAFGIAFDGIEVALWTLDDILAD